MPRAKRTLPMQSIDLVGSRLRAEGCLGVFYPRDKTLTVPTLVEVNFDNFRNSAFRVLHHALNHMIRCCKTPGNVTINDVEAICSQLANGIAVMLYMRLRSINTFDLRVSDRYRCRPMVPEHFQVPTPFALAITQLGKVKLSQMTEEIYLSPSIPAAAAATFGCQAGFVWSPVDYSSAVVIAKSYGMRFSDVDLESKLGSSWWLYRPTNEGREFRLDCPYPEENFSSDTVILAALFCNNATGGFVNPIIDLATLGAHTYGSFMRMPSYGISLEVFYAITEEK